jgi:predicted exporter
LRPARLEPFVADVQAARAAPAITPASLAGTAFDALVDGTLLRGADGRWTAVLALRAAQPGAAIDADAVRGSIAQVPGAAFIDLRAELDRLYAGYLRRALALSALGFLVIVALLFAALRSPARVLRVMAPLAAGVAVVAAAHVLAGTRLSLLHLVGLLLVVAVGSNYALFFDRMATARGAATPRTLASLALANATTVASFGLIAFSTIPVLHAIGSTVAAGALATLLFAAAFAPRPAADGA